MRHVITMLDTSDNDILNNYGGFMRNSLVNIVDNADAEDEEPVIFEHSAYMNNDTLIDTLKTKANVFKVLALNCQSLYSKYNQLSIYVDLLQKQGCNFDAICLQETWLSDSHTGPLTINGYTLISQPRTCSAHGGLAVYLKSDFQFRIISNLANFTSWEHQFLEILVDDKTNTKLVLGNIYRLPRETNTDYEHFMNEFDLIYQQINRNSPNIALFGDFNIDLLKIKDKPKCNDFFELMVSYGLIPKITLPTRLSRSTATLIDNAFCKISREFSKTTCGILSSKISDHQSYFVCFDYLLKSRKTPKLIKVQNYHEEAFQKFNADLASYNFVSLLQKGTVDENYDILDTVLKNLNEKHFPFKMVKFNKYKHRKNNWITRAILNSIKFRDKLYVKLKKTPIDNPMHTTMKLNLATYNKILKTSIRLAKLQYYHDTLKKFRKDIKNTWITIKEIINHTKNKKNLPKLFRINEENVSDPQRIANSFNEYFNQIGPQLSRNISHPNRNITFKDFLPVTTHRQFDFHEVSEKHILDILTKLPTKTSRGIDGFSTKFLKEIKSNLLTPLHILVNQAIKTGKFPQKLKIARIVPVYKKEDETLISNYRPISVLPAISKIFEKVIQLQLNEYFESQKLLFPSQYGFRERHNTEFAVIENMDRVVDCMEKKGTPLNIFLDLSKAFDTLDHLILLEKLSYYGIRGNAFNLCKSYLTNRKQFVEYDSCQSDLLPITTGVPQGSILGPLFFLIYMNDFDRSTNMFRFIMYADDTTLLASLSSTNSNTNTETSTNTNTNNELQNRDLVLNRELDKICEWLKVNKLSLNVPKTKYMIFRPKNKIIADLNLFLDGHKLERVTNFDFLGIVVDECLTWNNHIHKIQMKISKTVGVMNRIKAYLPSETLLIIYNSLIYPHLLYGALLWGIKYTKLEKLQRRSIRTINKSKYNADADPLFKKTNVLKLEDILYVQEFKFYYKLINKKAPKYFLDFKFQKQSDIHPYPTRDSDNLVTPLLKYESSKCSIRNRIPKLVNDAPESILGKIQTHSISWLSSHIKTTKINSYPT